MWALGLQSLEHLLSGPLQKRRANACPRSLFSQQLAEQFTRRFDFCLRLVPSFLVRATLFLFADDDSAAVCHNTAWEVKVFIRSLCFRSSRKTKASVNEPCLPYAERETSQQSHGVVGTDFFQYRFVSFLGRSSPPSSVRR